MHEEAAQKKTGVEPIALARLQMGLETRRRRGAEEEEEKKFKGVKQKRSHVRRRCKAKKKKEGRSTSVGSSGAFNLIH